MRDEGIGSADRAKVIRKPPVIDTEERVLMPCIARPQTLEMINQGGGKYLVGLKANQKALLKQAVREMESQAFYYQSTEQEKGHGRIETRSYEFYDLLEMKKADRWKDCRMQVLIKVNRLREELKAGKKSMETSYYVSNQVGTYEELREAIRRHWQVETNNHIRDVTLKEDYLRSKKRISVEHWQKLEHWQQLF